MAMRNMTSASLEATVGCTEDGRPKPRACTLSGYNLIRRYFDVKQTARTWCPSHFPAARARQCTSHSTGGGPSAGSGRSCARRTGAATRRRLLSEPRPKKMANRAPIRIISEIAWSGSFASQLPPIVIQVAVVREASDASHPQAALFASTKLACALQGPYCVISGSTISKHDVQCRSRRRRKDELHHVQSEVRTRSIHSTIIQITVGYTQCYLVGVGRTFNKSRRTRRVRRRCARPRACAQTRRRPGTRGWASRTCAAAGARPPSSRYRCVRRAGWPRYPAQHS
jgi:hypothetical protein